MCAPSRIFRVAKVDIGLISAYELLGEESFDIRLVAYEYDYLLNEKSTNDNPTDRNRNTKLIPFITLCIQIALLNLQTIFTCLVKQHTHSRIEFTY